MVLIFILLAAISSVGSGEDQPTLWVSRYICDIFRPVTAGSGLHHTHEYVHFELSSLVTQTHKFHKFTDIQLSDLVTYLDKSWGNEETAENKEGLHAAIVASQLSSPAPNDTDQTPNSK